MNDMNVTVRWLTMDGTVIAHLEMLLLYQCAYIIEHAQPVTVRFLGHSNTVIKICNRPILMINDKHIEC